ncbi:glycosyltransferase family 2 protein [Streptomyces massasporeus]|uniref:glycosyltransferase family 2 protein n=1 Tax=Streptomyces massasporeus TaxID=67324 RepID=UPI0036CD824E
MTQKTTEPLAVIVPTRGRPQNATRLQQAFAETDSLNATLVFVADADDPELPAYRDGLDGAMLLTFSGETGTGMVAALNRAAGLLAPQYDALGFMGDDHLPRTAGWDAHVLGALNGPWPTVVYGNDLFQGERLPTAAFLPSRVVQALGFMAPPVLRHLYVDNFWLELGTQLGGLRYLPDVVIEHIHPAAGKTSMDERYAAVNAPEADVADRLAWLGFHDGGGFAAALRRVREEYSRDAHSAA